MISSCFRSYFLSDLYCSHSEVKLVANIKLVAAKKEGTNNTVGSAYGYERVVNGSNHNGVKCFFIRLSFECNFSNISRFMF